MKGHTKNRYSLPSMHELIGDEMESLRHQFGLTGRKNDLYVGFTEGMARRNARGIAITRAHNRRRQLKDELFRASMKEF